MPSSAPPSVQSTFRLRPPAGFSCRHFLYKTPAPALPEAALAALTEYGRQAVVSAQLGRGQIEILSTTELSRSPAKAAWLELCTALGEHLGVPYSERETGHRFGLLACFEAYAHSDPYYTGSAFASLVLHTGPSPYVLQTFTVQPMSNGTLDVVSSSRKIAKGELIVFDPAIPHMCVPYESNREALLLLLQVEVPDGTDEERAALVKRLPRCAEDHDHDAMDD